MLINVFIVFGRSRKYFRLNLQTPQPSQFSHHPPTPFAFLYILSSIIAALFTQRRRKFASYMFAKIKLLLTGFSFDVNSNLLWGGKENKFILVSSIQKREEASLRERKTFACRAIHINKISVVFVQVQSKSGAKWKFSSTKLLHLILHLLS